MFESHSAAARSNRRRAGGSRKFHGGQLNGRHTGDRRASARTRPKFATVSSSAVREKRQRAVFMMSRRTVAHQPTTARPASTRIASTLARESRPTADIVGGCRPGLLNITGRPSTPLLVAGRGREQEERGAIGCPPDAASAHEHGDSPMRPSNNWSGRLVLARSLHGDSCLWERDRRLLRPLESSSRVSYTPYTGRRPQTQRKERYARVRTPFHAAIVKAIENAAPVVTRPPGMRVMVIGGATGSIPAR